MCPFSVAKVREKSEVVFILSLCSEHKFQYTIQQIQNTSSPIFHLGIMAVLPGCLSFKVVINGVCYDGGQKNEAYL